ncbi:MAG: BACON domain-containing protein [Alistipes sp.]|nr:BACON domain-containing protein [Alistipes sp.]
MKKVITIVALLLASCTEPEPEIQYNDIYIDPTYDDVLEVVGVSKSEFDGTGGKAEIIVKSNLTYSVTSDKEWLRVPVTRAEALPQNEAVVFEVLPYEIDYSGKQRTATISVAAADSSFSKTITITQTPSNTYHVLLRSMTPQRLTSMGGEIVVTLDATLAYTTSLEQNDWLQLLSDDGKGAITLYAKKNTGSSDRACTLTISAEGCEPLSITIMQTSFLSEHDNVIVVPLPDGGLQ